MKSLLKFLFKAMFVIFLIGAILETLTTKIPPPLSPAETGTGSYPNPLTPQNSTEPRFQDPVQRPYERNYYQAYNEVVFELRSAGQPEDQIRLACMAMEATKCRRCNGYGMRGHYRCEACMGDGILEN